MTGSFVLVKIFTGSIEMTKMIYSLYNSGDFLNLKISITYLVDIRSIAS